MDKKHLPENLEAVKELHKDVQSVRTPRQRNNQITYAFIEFLSEAKCEKAKVIFITIYVSGKK